MKARLSCFIHANNRAYARWPCVWMVKNIYRSAIPRLNGASKKLVVPWLWLEKLSWFDQLQLHTQGQNHGPEDSFSTVSSAVLYIFSIRNNKKWTLESIHWHSNWRRSKIHIFAVTTSVRRYWKLRVIALHVGCAIHNGMLFHKGSWKSSGEGKWCALVRGSDVLWWVMMI